MTVFLLEVHTITIYLFNHTLFKLGLIILATLLVLKVAAWAWEKIPFF